MKNPVLVVQFTVVERDALTPEHLKAATTEGLHLSRMYAMRDVADGCAGFIVGTEAAKFWDSAVMMGVFE